MSTRSSALDPRILGELLLMQSVVVNLPDDAVFGFVTRGLGDLPGVAEVRFAEPGETPDDACFRCFSLAVGEGAGRGELLFRIVDPKALEPYLPYVENFCFMLAVILEERAQREIIRRNKENLESEVERRTRELRESEATLRAIITNTPNIVYIKNREGRFLLANAGLGELLGLPIERIEGKTVFELFEPEAASQHHDNDLLVFNDGRPRSFDETARAEDGPHHFLSVKFPIMGERGEVAAVGGISTDITERKNLELELIEAKEAAEAANRAKSEFLANMSHEIRTPMNGIAGMLQLLQRSEPDEGQQQFIDAALQSAKRLTGLLSDILDLSRVEAGRLLVQSEPFDLVHVVAQACELFESTARHSGVELHWRLDPRIPRTLRGDGARLQQVLVNLIGNAFKFTGQGQVFVEAWPLRAPGPGTARVLFSVADTGIGIPDDKLEKLFVPFSQVSEGYRREHQGAGLGLSICKRLVELMGGTVALESESGKGTTVYFSITCGVAEHARKPASPRSETDRKRSLRILLAEDEAVNRIATQRLLENQGHKVKSVENGERAVAAVKDEDFDVVLMDVQMPVMDGVEAVEAIRRGDAGGRNKDLPVIALTAYAMDGDKETFLAAGMNEYVAKPVDQQQMQDVLAMVAQGTLPEATP